MDFQVLGQGGQISLDISSKHDAASVVKNMEVVEKTEVANNDETNDELNEKKRLEKAVNKLNMFLEDDNTHAEYSFHDKFKNTLMIKIVDDKTQKTIMEVPPKKIVDMVAKMCELAGVLLDKKA